jgi:ABC-type lipoprotein export system ATPase subunit
VTVEIPMFRPVEADSDPGQPIRLSAELQPVLNGLSGRSREVAHIFGIDGPQAVPALFRDLPVPTRGLVLICGHSGAGKTSLLSRLAMEVPGLRTPADLPPACGPVIDLFPGSAADAIAWLGRFGLSEARVLITPAERLSVGQAHRLMLARLLWDQPDRVAVDEFLSTVDRTTAQIVAHGFQKVCRQFGVTAFVCTAHDDLVDALDPDHVVRLDLDGRHESVPRARHGAPPPASEEITVESGTIEDYLPLAPLHYRFGNEPSEFWQDMVHEVRIARYQDRVIAARLFSRPFSRQWERVALCGDLNRSVLVQERTVVHPAFRGIGLTHRLVPTRITGQRLLFTHSAMGRFVPFHMHSGFERVDHPSARPLPAQLDMLRVLKYGLPDVNPNSLDSVRLAVAALAPSHRAKLLEYAQRAFLGMNMRFADFLAGLAAVKVDRLRLTQLASFLAAISGSVPVDDTEVLAAFVESCAPFEVAGFARGLNGYHLFGYGSDDDILPGGVTDPGAGDSR